MQQKMTDMARARLPAKRALIVDDSRAQRMIFARHLQQWGYQTEEAACGQEALHRCGDTHFDLILSDWIMPGMDGLEFCRAFRALPLEQYSYFILLTSKNDKDAVAEGLDVGADDFLSKPVSPAELRARISAGERLLAMEREVRTARGQLVAAVEALDDAFVYYDAEDRLVLANDRFRELYRLSAPALVEGTRYEDILRYGIAQGQYPGAIGREEEWLRERLGLPQGNARTRQQLADGRVLQIVERRTADGGRVSLRVDVTELHAARDIARRAEAQAKRQNEELRAALEELQKLYDALDRDLMQARRLQQSLIRKRHHDYSGSRLSLLLQSSGHVGGDMVGTFVIDEARIGIYAIDVSGHGVAAAMLGARIAGLFTGGDRNQNIALCRDPATGATKAWPPHVVASRINELMLDEFETETYLTIAYADLDLTSGKVSLVQAGHPHPALQRADGRVEFLGDGGLPIGLIPQAEYATIEASLMPGDRLFLYSDGITECANPAGEEYGEEGLERALRKLGRIQGAEFLDALKWDLSTWSGKEEFDDDVSGALLEYLHAAETSVRGDAAGSGPD
ncbi:MAG: SpoIIE family protein phosphatase [Natronohydrobacter sp.]|nr:SpoIIE family protein phosphatase [Natronohydrobacter sp.]